MCTGIRLIAADGTVVHARTMEFGVDLRSEVIVVPVGYERYGTVPATKENNLDGAGKGAKWTAKYACVGANGFGMDVIVDGLNSAGLAAGIFYFPTSAGYMSYTEEDASRTIAPWELGSWILEQHATVDEVRTKIKNLVVADVVFEEMGFAPPVHVVVHDASGQSIVIEYVKGKLNVHNNPLGVMSNSPAFDWHMTNLRNYLNFSTTNLHPLELKVPPYITEEGIEKDTVKIEPFGQGTGMLGMPGDLTPPSRFVRAVAFSRSILPELLETGRDAVLQAFHILNNFDIPKGVAREPHGEKVEADYTIWTSVNDLKEKRFFFRTYNNSQIRVVNLMEAEINASYISKYPMGGKEDREEFTTVTPTPAASPR
ncbi:choloylglycine hydrolase family protein [Pannus brasiliensis CCIBt3594]|uniref:Choloylglycine hydrolase family protein n=1 Tax=Pannus brasiliensis CCIBt3594 TaxID=1427578 RepID=A0AAW9QVE0_9CHRO